MGYTTDFDGRFTLNRTLAPEHQAYLKAFSKTRRMKRDAAKTVKRPDPKRVAVGLSVGEEGGYFVGAQGPCGQEDFDKIKAPDVLDYNREPAGQPSLWCDWSPSEDGDGIEWNGSEKFYGYVEWLEYLIEHFLKPWGYVLNGVVRWQGEDPDDRGTIVVTHNAVATRKSSPPCSACHEHFELGDAVRVDTDGSLVHAVDCDDPKRATA